MEVLTGTKRKITIAEWKEEISRYQKRLFDDMECFSLFGNYDDIEMASEDIEKLKAALDHTLSAMKFMHEHGIS